MHPAVCGVEIGLRAARERRDTRRLVDHAAAPLDGGREPAHEPSGVHGRGRGMEQRAARAGDVDALARLAGREAAVELGAADARVAAFDGVERRYLVVAERDEQFAVPLVLRVDAFVAAHAADLVDGVDHHVVHGAGRVGARSGPRAGRDRRRSPTCTTHRSVPTHRSRRSRIRAARRGGRVARGTGSTRSTDP